MKTNIKTNLQKWGLLALVCALLAGTLALLPAPAQAATTIWSPGHMFGQGGSVLPGFWVTGEVAEVAGESVTLQLPNQHHARGMMRYVNLQVTLAVDSNTILLDEALESLALTTLQEGDEVVVSPRLVWGNLVAQLLYAGDPEDLAEATYRGTLVEVEGDTLTLKNRRDGEFTVVVDANTVWYDGGPMERPTDLPEDITLRILGTTDIDPEVDSTADDTTSDTTGEENEDNDDENSDEDVIRAILITPGR